jgi:filamentous hemagglutinin family protein
MLRNLLHSLSLIPFLSLVALDRLNAQIIPDSSLGNENSIVSPDVIIKDNPASLIEGGAIRNNSLFHSFSEFNIEEGNRIYFANPEGIQNIFSRVTGNNLSQILGTLGVNGNANLFLINPNGIIFGNNARLDLNGSFVATTAKSVLFNDNIAFSSNNPQPVPLLTINTPIGLQFGSKAEPIINRSQITNEIGNKIGITVNPEQNITLLGGNVLFEAGYLTAPNGRIEIGSVAPISLVEIVPIENNWQLNYRGVNKFQDISLTQGAVISSGSGDGTGNINIQANKLSVLEGSFIAAENLGEINGGKLTIKATESIEVRGNNADDINSYISTDIYDSGKGATLSIKTKTLLVTDGGFISAATDKLGNAGNIDLEVENLSITNGAQIFSGTFGAGNGGNINIKASFVEAIGTNEVDFPTGIFVGPQPDAIGNGGNINVKTGSFLIRNGAQIASATFSEGDAGNIVIHASELVEITGVGVVSDVENEGKLNIFSSGLFASVLSNASGNGGNVIIETDNLIVTEGGKIVALTLGSGNGGNLFIRANNLEVKGTILDEDSSTRSGINSTVELQGTGNGGNVEIITNNLRLIDGGSIAVDAKGNGNAGNLTINALNIEILGVSSGEPIFGVRQERLPSQISAFSQGDFEAGSIIINTNSLTLDDRGNISVSNLGNGDAGNIQITTTALNLDRFATIEARVNAGSQGNINLNSDRLILNNNSQITTNATREAIGGNIEIGATNLVSLEKSSITANSSNSFGGKIFINTQGQFISPDSQITALGKSPQFNGIVQINTPDIDPSSGLVELSVSVVEPDRKIVTSCSLDRENKLTVRGIESLPSSPLALQTGATIWQDLRSSLISTNNNSEAILTEQKSLFVEAKRWITNKNGNLELIAESDRPNSIVSNNCDDK